MSYTIILQVVNLKIIWIAFFNAVRVIYYSSQVDTPMSIFLWKFHGNYVSVLYLKIAETLLLF